MAKQDIDISRLRDLLAYDPDTGVFTWRVRSGPRAAAESVAGSLKSNGYRRIMVCGADCFAHRLAWAHANDRWPAGQIDHIDGNRTNNRIANLRDVPQSINMQNQRAAHSNNKSSGMLGVCADGDRWMARIRVDGKRLYIGTFDTKELAHASYLAAKRIHHEGSRL